MAKEYDSVRDLVEGLFGEERAKEFEEYSDSKTQELIDEYAERMNKGEDFGEHSRLILELIKCFHTLKRLRNKYEPPVCEICQGRGIVAKINKDGTSTSYTAESCPNGCPKMMFGGTYEDLKEAAIKYAKEQ